MNNQLIQEIFENKINFYIFKLKDLNNTEREILIENLKSKIIIKNPMYERMMHNEITKIEQMKEDEKDYNKYITIIIQYLINENNYTSDDIKKIIEKVKMIVSMLEDNDVEMEDVNMRMNNFIYKLNLGENDNTIKYVKQLKDVDYLELKELLYIGDQEDIIELLNIMIEPFIKYKYQNSEKYVADDLILKFLHRFNEDKFTKNKEVVQEKILQYLTNDDNSISLEFLLKNNDISRVYSYLNIFKKSNNVKFIQFCQKLKKYNNQVHINNRPKNFCDFSQHKEYINVGGLNSKRDQELVELLYIVGRGQLKIFLKELNYGKYYNELQKINIITYQKLENLVLNNKIIKKCRSNKKILPGKVLKNIIFTILNKNNKLELMKKIQEKNNDIEMEILEMKFEKLCVNPIDENEKNIKELKQQKINMENLILLLKENNEDVNEIEKELKQIKNKLKNSMLDCDTREELLNENINELALYLENNLNLEVNDKNNIKGMIRKYQNELDVIPEKKYGNNFIQNVPAQRVYNQFDQRLTNIINKFEEEDKKQQKEDKKKKYFELQNEIVTNDLKFLINVLDKKYDDNLLSKYEMISDFFKYKMKDIMPFIYKNLNINENKYQKNNMVYQKLRTIIHVFLIISICMKKNLNHEKIYDTKDNIVKINKKVQKVIIKCNGKEADLIDQVGDCYFVDYLDTIIELKEDEIEIIKDLKGKTCKIIKGNNKGLLGVIYQQKNDYVLLTKDLYGKNNGHYIPGLSILKIPVDHIKIIEEIENEKEIIENKELYDIFNKKSKDLYSLVKFELNKSYNMKFLSDFDLIYKFSIELFNNYKITETEKFSYVKTLKHKYFKIKKEIKDNKNNKRVYIRLNKELKKLHSQIREGEKSTKFIKDSLFNSFRNLNENYIFNKNDEGIYQLKEYEIKNFQNNKQVVTKEQKKINKKLKIQKEKDDIKRTVDNYKKDVANMLNNLLD